MYFIWKNKNYHLTFFIKKLFKEALKFEVVVILKKIYIRFIFIFKVDQNTFFTKPGNIFKYLWQPCY